MFVLVFGMNSCSEKQSAPTEYEIIYRNQAGDIRSLNLLLERGKPNKRMDTLYAGFALYEAYWENERDSIGYVALGDIFQSEKERDIAERRFRNKADSILDEFKTTPNIFGEHWAVKNYGYAQTKRISAKLGKLIFVEDAWYSFDGGGSSLHTNTTEIWKKLDTKWVVQDTSDFAELTRKFNLKNQDILRNGNYAMRWKGNKLNLVEYNVADMPEKEYPMQGGKGELDSLRVVDKKLVYNLGDSLEEIIGPDFGNIIGIEKIR